MSSFDDTGSSWALVIDTDAYAGNFERQLTAFCTGHVGECNVGSELADRFDTEVDPDPFPDDDETEEDVPMIDQRPDEYGCFRPCAIHTNPRWFNDGLGHHYRVDDHPSEEEMVRVHRQEEEDEGVDPWDPEMTSVPQAPAYMSVAIFFEALPTADQVRVIRERAQRFFAEGWHGGFRGVLVNPPEPPPVHIEGFRLIERTVVLTEHPLSDI